MLGIKVDVIPNEEQRYPTVGDWKIGEVGLYENGEVMDRGPSFSIHISSMRNWKYELLVAVHELVEVALCYDRGITDEVVSAFDIKFEEERERGLHDIDDEPGNHPDAPYFKEHHFATYIEQLLAGELDVDWGEYDKTVMEL